MKRIDTGGLQFPDLIDEGYYFVDKSMLIADMLESNPRGIYLYTRPRRFGKSTNLSMLDAFFNIRYRGNSWFDGLAISDYSDLVGRHMNQYPVISLDMKDLSHRSREAFLDSLNGAVIEAIDPFADILKGSSATDADQLLYRHIIERSASEDELFRSVRMVSKVLSEHYGSRAVMLIDEYDRTVTNSYGSDSHADVLSAFGTFMSATFKSNPSLQMGYVTGVMQVAKAGMFSGLNNLKVNNVFSTRSDERFGFTEGEVKEILSYYGHPERFDEVRDWYDGYRFGDAEVYNPFSVMSYVARDFVPMNYWVNTSSVTPVKWMIERVDAESLGEVADMISGGQTILGIRAEMTYDDLSGLRREDLYSLMVQTGYLKAIPQGDGRYALSVPNREVMSTLDDLVGDIGAVSGDALRSFAGAVATGDAERIASSLEEALGNASYFNLRDESSYALVVLTLLHASMRDYDVRSERESGNGRCDLLLTPKRDGRPAIIMELKVSRSEADLPRDAESAIAQIHDRRYYMGMSGDVVLVGTSFWGKVPCVRTEVLRPGRP